jgi:hypothetical protein
MGINMERKLPPERLDQLKTAQQTWRANHKTYVEGLERELRTLRAERSRPENKPAPAPIAARPSPLGQPPVGSKSLAERLDPLFEGLFDQGCADHVAYYCPSGVHNAGVRIERLLIEHGIMPGSPRSNDTLAYARKIVARRKARTKILFDDNHAKHEEMRAQRDAEKKAEQEHVERLRNPTGEAAGIPNQAEHPDYAIKEEAAAKIVALAQQREADLVRARARIVELEAELRTRPHASIVAQQREEMDGLRRQLDRHERLDQPTETAKLKTQNKSLQTRVRTLEEKLSYLTQRHNKQIADAYKKAGGITGGMPKELLNKLRKCAHSDRTPSPEERHEAMIGLNAWVEDFERAAPRSGPLPGFWGK